MTGWLIAAGIGALVGSALTAYFVVRRWCNRRAAGIRASIAKTDAQGPDSPADRRVIEISQLAGGLAHEIRNPLSTLLLNLKLLEEDLAEAFDEDAAPLRRARLKIGVARTEAERLQRQLDEFLLLVRPVQLRTEPADLNDVVEQLIEFYTPEARRRQITLRFQPAGAPLLCAVDPQALKQALLNLLINAQQAIPGSGEIIVTVHRDGERLCIEVTDTGAGMTPEVAARALHAFYSTKPNGSGLGLSTTLRIIEAHGGSLQLDSKPGAGTRCTIRLPAAPKSV